MTSITSSIENLISSILSVFRSLLGAVLSVFQSFAAVITSALSSVFELIRGLFGFLLSNILVIGLLVAAFFGYTAYQQRQGRSVQGTQKKAA